MNTRILNQNDEVAQEIFRQLKGSSVNGFPFLAYTGARAQIYSETALYLKAPKNPGRVNNVLVQYEYGSDLYTVIFNGSERLEDIYADQLAEVIARKMGVL